MDGWFVFGGVVGLKGLERNIEIVCRLVFLGGFYA